MAEFIKRWRESGANERANFVMFPTEPCAPGATSVGADPGRQRHLYDARKDHRPCSLSTSIRWLWSDQKRRALVGVPRRAGAGTRPSTLTRMILMIASILEEGRSHRFDRLRLRHW